MGAARQSSFIDADDPPRPEHEAETAKRFHIFWRHPGEKKEVKETYEQITDDPEKWGREIINWFNSTLRPHETKRVFVRCEFETEIPPPEHKWFKVTLMTKSNQYGASYDGMKCERCGITGKRYGLMAHTKPDSKYRLKVFARCDTSVEWLKTHPL